MEKITTILKANLFYIIGGIVGGVVGYFYWKLVGCSTGSCAITSKPLNSIAYFSLLGGLLFGLFKRK